MSTVREYIDIQHVIVRLTGMKTMEPEGTVKTVLETLVFITTQLTKLIAPLASGVATYLLLSRGLISNLELGLVVWSVLEVVFYFYCWYIHRKLSKTTYGTNLSDERRNQLAKEMVVDGHCPYSLISKWFLPLQDSPVTVSQLETWLAWAFFNKEVNMLNEKESERLQCYVETCKCKAICEIPTTDKFDRKPMRLTLDPVLVQHKPMVFYTAICLLQTVGAGVLMSLGFHCYTLIESNYTYWIYEPTNIDRSKPPIFFIHGIGVGVSMYVKKVYDLQRMHPNRHIILLELPYVSLTPVSSIQSLEVTVDAIAEIFKLYKLPPASFVGHSYGTVICSWVAQFQPKLVHKLTLVDPVCFAMWEPELTRNFMYNQSPSFVHRMCQFFVSKDVFTANTIGRHFQWYRNILLPSDITRPCQVYLSRYDFIINAPSTYKYLINSTLRHPDLDLKVHMIDEVTHGSYLISKSHSKLVLSNV